MTSARWKVICTCSREEASWILKYAQAPETQVRIPLTENTFPHIEGRKYFIKYVTSENKVWKNHVYFVRRNIKTQNYREKSWEYKSTLWIFMTTLWVYLFWNSPKRHLFELLEELSHRHVHLDASLCFSLEESIRPGCIYLFHSNDASFGSTHQ